MQLSIDMKLSTRSSNNSQQLINIIKSSSSRRHQIHSNIKSTHGIYMWCWRRMEKISWTCHVRNEEVSLRVKEHSIILHEISKLKANWIGHILRINSLLRQVIEGKIIGGTEVTGRRGRRRRKLLDDLEDSRGYSHL
jgi:hypothetical protein